MSSFNVGNPEQSLARTALYGALALSLFAFVACGDSTTNDTGTGSGSGTTGGSASTAGTGTTGGASTTGGAPAHTAENLPLACTIFTHDVAAKLTTETLGATGAEDLQTTGRYCKYTSADGKVAPVVQIAWSTGGASYYDVICSDGKGTKLAGYGDEACFYPGTASGGGGLFFALSGQYTITLITSTGTAESMGPAVKDMIGKLP